MLICILNNKAFAISPDLQIIPISNEICMRVPINKLYKIENEEDLTKFKNSLTYRYATSIIHFINYLTNSIKQNNRKGVYITAKVYKYILNRKNIVKFNYKTNTSILAMTIKKISNKSEKKYNIHDITDILDNITFKETAEKEYNYLSYKVNFKITRLTEEPEIVPQTLCYISDNSIKKHNDLVNKALVKSNQFNVNLEIQKRM